MDSGTSSGANGGLLAPLRAETPGVLDAGVARAMPGPDSKPRARRRRDGFVPMAPGPGSAADGAPRLNSCAASTSPELPVADPAGSDRPREGAASIRRRPNQGGQGAGRLRALPRARGELDLLQIRDPFATFDDLLLPESHRHTFGQLLLEVEREGMLLRNGVAPRRTLLFTGPPGTGKSITAEALARELDREFAVVNLSTVVSSFLGDTAKNLSSIFAAAASERWVVLFDEFDAIGKERAERTDHGELKRVVTAFLQQLDNFEGPSILVAATNHPDLIDLAVWRRFQIVLQFDPPSVHGLRDLLRLELRPLRREAGFDIEAAASACRGLTQADVSEAVEDAHRAHLLSSASKKPLALEELLGAVEAAQERNRIASSGRP
jgi:AAA+ superfamily predicted ATPase